ncbi:spermatogenesis-associated serine-rich protein 1 [Plakobranchus ocellatus]|uniref:Spermatogenesis-associated serine-rich protein 1 n=1 Tax=Plakobranchus ocellatus TaxID=259542 RepID=A0AAV3YNR3_9GAST|nr:spermatogenesis-associated serine-rich protein 1 [Plakobranchus ocellatus]
MIEREKRHFPDSHNQPGPHPIYKPRGRRYIPHSNGREDEWRPHNQSFEPELTEAGPDWSSRLKYLPHPENPEYPAAEIWPNNWRSMRPYPYTYKRSDNEWILDPGLTKVGLRCMFDGVHKATAISENELTHSMMFGKGRNEEAIDKRNELNEASPGDKSYQVPEYSPSFHQTQREASAPKFRETHRQVQEVKHKQEEIDDVRRLDSWQPAKPISTTVPQLDPADLKKY